MRILLLLILLTYSNFSLAQTKLLHASFDVTRELFQDINHNFGQKILQSHGGSGKQTSAVIHGLPADVISLAMAYHMDILANKDKVAENWRDLFPNNSSPMSTKIVFLVKKTNPQNILDWSDLAKPGLKVIIGNPKTSGGALWNYVALWIYSMDKFNKNITKSIDFIHKIYTNAPILDSSARNSAITFLKRHIGDVLITWESEAKHIINNLSDDYEIIEPSFSLKIELPIAISLKSKNYNLAKNYVDFLYSQEGQEIITKHYYIPLNHKVESNLKIAEDYIEWNAFKKQHFEENGVFDKIYR